VRILCSWLRELVPVEADAARLGADLQRCGFELAGLEPLPDGDAVLDVEVTANRPDCLSMLGIAREVGTLYGLPVRSPVPSGDPGDAAGQRSARLDGLAVEIEDAERCPRYVAAIADVTVAPSPAWLAARLHAVGIRAINNVVDVTNYVLAEIGQPMHAFDLARLGGAALRIRTARPGERLTTLDGQGRTLGPEMLVIADAARAQAVAGVMGGAESEVTARTRTIVLESAYFAPRSVRRTAKALGLSTEASYRFERGTDPTLPARAARYACELLARIGAGSGRAEIIDCHPTPWRQPAVTLRGERVERLLGAAVPATDVERTLGGLGFVVQPQGDGRWTVAVPPWRGDVAREVDLIEEVARHYGYDRLPDTFPAVASAPAPPGDRLERDRCVRQLAAAAGFHESVTFSFIEAAAARPFATDPELVAIANPLSETFAVLRPSLVPGLVDSVSHNRRRGRPDVRLFEVGSRFTRTLGETRTVAFAWTGAAAAEHWSGSGRTVDFFDLKGVVESLASLLGAACRFDPLDCPWLRPGQAALVSLVGRDRAAPIGFVGELRPAVAEARGIPAADAVMVAEIDLDQVPYDPRRAIAVAALPRFPAVVRDVALVVPEHLMAQTIHGTIRRAAPPTLVAAAEFDRYQGRALAPGTVSLAIRLTFQAADRTLTDVEVQQAVEAILRALADDHGVRLR
jgi:phenylalanyl-tRNA synthetase beta chain